jgi:hypothetical protein
VDDAARPALVYLNLFLVFLWGLLAVFFMNPAAIGLGVSSTFMVLAVIYTFELRARTPLLLKEAVSFLGEGSQLYLDSLTKAKAAAKVAQLTFRQRVTPVGQGAGGQGSSGKGAGSGDDKKVNPADERKGDAPAAASASATSTSASSSTAGGAVVVDVKKVEVDLKRDEQPASPRKDGDDADLGHLEQSDVLLLEELEAGKIGGMS